MMKPVVLSEKVEKQDPKGPFFKHKSYDHFLSFTDVGKKCFYQQEADFAAVSEYLLSNVEVMRQELSQITETDFIKWPESICQTGWTVFGLIGFGREMTENTKRCPKTTEIVKTVTEKYGFQVPTAGFSSLAPNTWIEPHRGYDGYSDFVVRLHVPLVLPKEFEKCSIRVGNEANCWEQGKALIFDDFLTHEAWNYSTETRIILLMDLRYLGKDYLKNYDQEEIDVQTANYSDGLKDLLTDIDTKYDKLSFFK